MSTSPLPELWSNLENNWENPAAHKALLEQCLCPEQLAEAARRYRGELLTQERAVVAEQQLRRITALALAKLEVKRESRPKRPPVGKLILAAFFLLGSAILASFL